MSNNLRTARKKRGLSQAKLAQLLGINAPMISDIELGKRLPYPKIKRLAAKFFGVPEVDLFPEAENDQ